MAIADYTVLFTVPFRPEQTLESMCFYVSRFRAVHGSEMVELVSLSPSTVVTVEVIST